METDSRGFAAQPVRTDDRADMDTRSRDYSLGPPASMNNFQHMYIWYRHRSRGCLVSVDG